MIRTLSLFVVCALAAAQTQPTEVALKAAKQALDSQQWENAIKDLNAAAQNVKLAPEALYWAAYAQDQAGELQESLSILKEMELAYPQSPWVWDAKALSLQVQTKAGMPIDPNLSSDENIKLLALSSLMESNPSQTVPLLEKMLKGTGSNQLKERALFVLTQTSAPEARKLLDEVARGSLGPDLQLKAVRYLSMAGGADARKMLGDIYHSAADARVKRQIIESMLLSGDSTRLVEIARDEKDPALRAQAIRIVGLKHDKAIADLLLSIYRSDSDPQVRHAVLNAFSLSGDARSLVAIARAESDPKVKERIVSELSMMHSKEANDFLLEQLK